MRGLALFIQGMRNSPGRTLARVAYDYGLYAGMCLFTVVLFVLKYPIALFDRLFNTGIREKFIDLIDGLS